MDITTLGTLLLMIWMGCFAWEFISPVRRKMRELEAKNARLVAALTRSIDWSRYLSQGASSAQINGCDVMAVHFQHESMNAILDWNWDLTETLEKEAD